LYNLSAPPRDASPPFTVTTKGIALLLQVVQPCRALDGGYFDPGGRYEVSSQVTYTPAPFARDIKYAFFDFVSLRSFSDMEHGSEMSDIRTWTAAMASEAVENSNNPNGELPADSLPSHPSPTQGDIEQGEHPSVQNRHHANHGERPEEQDLPAAEQRRQSAEQPDQTADYAQHAALSLQEPEEEEVKAGSDRPKMIEDQDTASCFRRLLCDTWFYESFAMCLSSLCLVAIGTILWAYDKHPSPQMKFGLTLNAIVSTLSTASKAGLVFSVASCISQLKWCWMQRQSRPLSDPQAFDDASRGFTGAVSILFTHNIQSMASLGAIITILAVAIGPFVQQLIRFPLEQGKIPSSRSSTKLARAVTLEPQSDMVAALIAGIWGNADEFEMSPSCPTKNCTWPSFQSVGWCTKCEDVTASAKVTNNGNFSFDSDFHVLATNSSQYYATRNFTFAIALEQGLPLKFPISVVAATYGPSSTEIRETSFDAPADLIWWVNGTTGSTSGRGPMTGDAPDLIVEDLILHNRTFNGVENPLIVLAHAAIKLVDPKDSTKGMVISKVDQCVLSMCERTYDIAVVDGDFTSTVSDPNWGSFQVYRYDDETTLFGWNGNVTNPAYDNAVSNFVLYWLADKNAAADVRFKDEYDAKGDAKHRAIPIRYNVTDYITHQILGEHLKLQCFQVDGDYWTHNPENYTSQELETVLQHGFESKLESIAASLTKLSLDQSEYTISGNMLVPVVYVEIQWIWFLLPCALEVAAIAFLIATIAVNESQNTVVWKSSVYALLYHGLDRSALDQQLVRDKVSGMEVEARSTIVRLRRSSSSDILGLKA
jgi:hypothetical protein